MYRVGIDIGGTFTDLIALAEDSGQLVIGKTLTTPQDPSVGAVSGLQQVLAALQVDARQVREIIHGTTLVANALIERRGARTGLVTTRGFRDVLEIGRERRYDIYDVLLEMPPPLVPRYLRREVPERLLPDGTVLEPLDEAAAAAVVRALMAEGVQAIAVVFLHAYRNPQHERRMAEIIRAEAPGVAVSLSSEVVPEIREYERTSTTVANAYAQPLMARYLARLQHELAALGYAGELYIMLSSGGLTTRETAEQFPIRIVESGPAAGAIAAARYGAWLDLRNVMSFDMGGTTAKTCLIDDGQPMITTEFEVAHVHRFKRGSGLPIKLPVIDMIEIGAGGGSIARIDDMGLLKVGPQSASAEPGPACYGRGGEEPTVTDADLLLGYLDPGYVLGGKMALDVERARAAIERKIAAPFGVDVVGAAWAIHEVVNENMANASRVHAVQRGRDPKTYSLVAFGGAGPVHAFGVARKLGLSTVIVPFGAGATSAAGFLMVPFAFNLVRTYVTRLPELDPAHVNALFAEMEAAGRAQLRAAGVPDEQMTFVRSCDLRYVGQGYEVAVPLEQTAFDERSRTALRAAFEREYARQFKRTNPHSEVEALNWRLIASGPQPCFRLQKVSAEGRSLAGARKGQRPVYFGEGFVPCPVYERSQLFPGASFEGPAIVEEVESTTVVGPAATVSVDEYLNLRIELR